jgi:site-specific recombinase XerD
MKLLLTEKFISHQLTCPPGKRRIEYCDTKIPGLFIEVRATSEGQGTLYLRYRSVSGNGTRGKTRYAKLGRTMDISLTDARKKAKKLRAEILLGADPGEDKRKRSPNWTEFFERWYLPAKAAKRSLKDDIKLHRYRLSEKYGQTPISDLTSHSIRLYHLELRQSGLSPASADRHLALLRHALNLAVEFNLLDKNPAAGLKLFNEDNRRDRLMTDAELQRLVAVLDSDPARTACLALKFCLYTPVRKGECLNLKWSDVNKQAETMTIQASTSKSKKRRVIPLNSGALTILDELSTGNNSEYVFENSRRPGERLKSVDKVWQRIRKSADLPADIVIHSLRHQGASMALAAGADLAVVRDLLGHANISTSEQYLHASGQQLRSGAAGIEDYLEKALANKAP